MLSFCRSSQEHRAAWASIAARSMGFSPEI